MREFKGWSQGTVVEVAAVDKLIARDEVSRSDVNSDNRGGIYRERGGREG
jgi:hypothetical protein